MRWQAAEEAEEAERAKAAADEEPLKAVERGAADVEAAARQVAADGFKAVQSALFFEFPGGFGRGGDNGGEEDVAYHSEYDDDDDEDEEDDESTGGTARKRTGRRSKTIRSKLSKKLKAHSLQMSTRQPRVR